MRFYEFGNKNNLSLMLLPGTCCHWKNNFCHVIKKLTKHFFVICASYDGFDENEDSQFVNMISEAEKIENYINENLNGSIHAIYGCSLGGSFIGILLSRNNIHMNHGILGSSDLDEMNEHDASKSAKILVPIIYHYAQKRRINFLLLKFLRWKFGRKYIDFFLEVLFGEKGQNITFVSKESIRNQYYSDLVTKLSPGIVVKGTTVHCFYASKMRVVYLNRYQKYFKNPHIVTFKLRHEELLATQPERWVDEVEKCIR